MCEDGKPLLPSGCLCCIVMYSTLLFSAVLCCAVCSFISEFLGSLCSGTRKALATVARLKNYKKDQVRRRSYTLYR